MLFLDVPGVQAANRTIEELADHLRNGRLTWSQATNDPDGATGYDEVESSFADMQDAWYIELTVPIEVLTQLDAAVDQAAQELLARDVDNAIDIQAGS